MPLLAIPTKARAGYIKLCGEANALPRGPYRAVAEAMAKGYFMAIADLCGDTVAGRIGMDADLVLPDDGRPACCGVYLD